MHNPLDANPKNVETIMASTLTPKNHYWAFAHNNPLNLSSYIVPTPTLLPTSVSPIPLTLTQLSTISTTEAHHRRVVEVIVEEVAT
jgi:hypothetical protein